MMDLPNGEGLYLTIDRVVERECDECKDYGEGYMFCYSCQKWLPHPICEECERHGYHDTMGLCPECDDTGRRKVRVRGWVEIGIARYPDNLGIHTVDRMYNVGGNDLDGMSNMLRESIITAFFAKTLPSEIAENIADEATKEETICNNSKSP